MRLLALLFLLPLSSFALTPLPPRQVPPQVWIDPGAGDLKPIALGDVAIDIRTFGFIARTSIELRFDNPNGRVLEGEFVFPLSAGQTVAGYALEVNGAMREGVVVEKETARVAFEDITRQQVDPGLAEITQGNVFRTRLYPIPARGSKRVRLSFEQVMSDGDKAWRYELPLHFTQTVGRFTVRARAALASAAPSGGGFAFERAGTEWFTELTRENVTPQRRLQFDIPKGEGSQIVEAVDPIEPQWRSVVALIAPPAVKDVVIPKRLALFVDASASAREQDWARINAVLRRYFERIGSAEVRLVVFRNEADPPQTFAVRDGRAPELLAALAALTFDGGSSYGSLTLPSGSDAALIIGDGLSNFGTATATLPVPTTALHAAQRFDTAHLQRFTRGAAVVDAHGDVDAASAALLGAVWHMNSRGNCEQQHLETRLGQLIWYGRCKGQGTLALTLAKGRERVEVPITFGVGNSDLNETVHRLWAQSQLAELGRSNPTDRVAMIALGKRYGVVTEGTSLLVLDRVEDYVRYRIEPKEPELRAQYLQQLAALPKTPADPDRAQRIAQLIQRWQAFKAYHAASYPNVESVLVPIAEQEAAAWPNTHIKDVAAGFQQAQALLTDARTLVARFARDGAEPDSAAKWRREASALMMAIEALRKRRESMPLVAQAADELAREERDDLAQVAVTGSRILDRDASAGEVRMAADAPGAPPPPAPSAAPAVVESIQPVLAESKAIGGSAPEPEPVRATIELTGWTPDSPDVLAIRQARDSYAAYLAARERLASSPAFFLDVADVLRGKKQDRLALRVLSNLAEMDVDNAALVRVLAYRLSEWERFDLAVPQFEKALALRGEEPQSYRDLALALYRQQAPDHHRAVDLLWQVATGDWHGRFPDIELIALHEMNQVLVSAPGATASVARLGIAPELIDPVAVGLRVVLSWDADNTDIDLWVVDPSGEKAYYSDPETPTGGHVSRDFTQGYGPEVFSIRRPLPGTYIVLANYYGDRRQSLTGPVTLQLEFQTRFGTTASTRAVTTRRLSEGKETIEIGRFTVE